MEGIRLFGPVSVHAADGSRPVGGPTRQAVLAVLALHRGRFVPRSELCAAVWRRSDVEVGAQGLAALRNEISRLRTALVGLATIETRNGGYRLVVADAAVDVGRFEQAVETGRDLADHEPAGAVERFDAALASWSGDPFGELSADVEVLAVEATRLTEVRIDAVERRSACLLRIGAEPSALAIELSQLVASHPYREGLWASLMIALYRAGRQADALEAYQRLRRLLAEELGISPTPALNALEAAILRHDRSLAPPATVAPPHPRPSGTSGTSGTSGNVPRRLDRFVGRDVELAGLSDLLHTERLITLTGPGGSGKTRLANELALANAHRFSAGAWFCELAHVPDDASVGFSVAERIGVKQAAGQSIVESLAEWAAPRQLLIVLDNCEHLRPGACELATTLLARCPDLVVVATSREPLGIGGEHVWRLAPLEHGSVELFEDRAGSAGCHIEDRAAVQRICARLDHLPLAIELAAARCRFLSPAEVLQRLDHQMEVLKDRSTAKDERHRTMRAAIAWSYDTLEPSEQRLLRAASVFRGGFSLRAAATITGADPFEVADEIEALVTRSLLGVERHATASRYRMLEPLRQFAADRLDEADRAELRHRHAAFFTDVAHEIGRGYESPDHAPALELFEADFANLRLAHQHLVKQGALDAAAAIVGAIGEVAAYRMQFEVLAWYDAEQAARAADRPEDPGEVDAIPFTALFEAGRLGATIALADRAIATAAALPRTRALAHIVGAWSRANTGELHDVTAHIDAAVRCASAAGLDYWVIEAVASRAQIAARMGEHPDRASAAGLQAIARAEAYGNESQLTLAYALGHHAATSHIERLDLLRRGLDYGTASGNLLMTAVCAYQLGDHLARDGGPLHEAAEPLQLALDQFSRGRVLTQLWNVLEIIAQRWADHGQFELPMLIWGCATAHQMQPITTKLPTSPAAHGRTELISAARARRDPAFTRGQRLTLDQLVAHVAGELASTSASPAGSVRASPIRSVWSDRAR